MKITNVLLSIAVAAGMAAAPAAWAQAPAGSTGQCKDNSYTNAASKRGACRGHGGVKEWYATAEKGEAATGKAAATPAKEHETTKSAKANETMKAAPTKSSSASARSEAAPGGGAGKVWLNTATNVYHCAGTRWYGKTKQGEYMTESEAKAKNAHPDHGKACA
jgi:hypothetical protein